MSEEERDAYVQKLLDEIPEYKAMEKEIEAQKAKLRKSAGRKFGGILRRRIFGRHP